MQAEVLHHLPQSITNSLGKKRRQHLGALPADRDEFDPVQSISKLKVGERILVLDSSKDLPPDWQDKDMADFFGREGPSRSAAPPGLVESDDGLTSGGESSGGETDAESVAGDIVGDDLDILGDALDSAGDLSASSSTASEPANRV